MQQPMKGVETVKINNGGTLTSVDSDILIKNYDFWPPNKYVL